MTPYEKGLNRNIIKYSWYKIFTKRLYLPLIAVQLVNVGKVSLEELAIIAAVTSIVAIILQVPSGYMADKMGNKFAIVFGSVIATVSPLFYIIYAKFLRWYGSVGFVFWWLYFPIWGTRSFYARYFNRPEKREGLL